MIRHSSRAVLLLSVVSLLLAERAPAPAADQGGIRVWFSPDGGCAQTVIEAVNSANKTLDIAAYHITHADIAQAIVAASRRGVSVRVVMDGSQSQGKYSSATFLRNAGLAVWIWKPGLMHHKVIIIDNKILLTGSFNFTKGADTSNAENLLRIEGKPRLVAVYRQQYDRLLRDAERYDPANSAPARPREDD